MRASLSLTAILGSLYLAAGIASAGTWCYFPPPPAPDMCGPGYYYNQCGTVYGPNYIVKPPFAPFQGMVKGPCGMTSSQAWAANAGCGYPTGWPYAAPGTPGEAMPYMGPMLNCACGGPAGPCQPCCGTGMGGGACTLGGCPGMPYGYPGMNGGYPGYPGLGGGVGSLPAYAQALASVPGGLNALGAQQWAMAEAKRLSMGGTGASGYGGAGCYPGSPGNPNALALSQMLAYQQMLAARGLACPPPYPFMGGYGGPGMGGPGGSSFGCYPGYPCPPGGPNGMDPSQMLVYQQMLAAQGLPCPPQYPMMPPANSMAGGRPIIPVPVIPVPYAPTFMGLPLMPQALAAQLGGPYQQAPMAQGPGSLYAPPDQQPPFMGQALASPFAGCPPQFLAQGPGAPFPGGPNQGLQQQQQQQSSDNGKQSSTMAFPSHLFSRSPRDFFMVETDPRASPYNSGPFSSSGRTSTDYP